MSIQKMLYSIVFAVMIAAGISCIGTNDIAGTSSGGEGRTIAGQYFDSAGIAVSGAKVTLRKTVQWSDAQSTPDTVATEITDTSGRYVFRKIAAGSYDILAVAPGRSLVSFVAGVSVDSFDRDQGAATMERSAIIRGKVMVALEYRIMVTLAGTPYTTDVLPDSSFVLEPVMPGSYQILVIARNFSGSSRSVIIASDSITATAGQDTVLPGIALRRINSGPGSVVVGAGTSCDKWNEVGGNWWILTDHQTSGSSVVIPHQDDLIIDQSDRLGDGCAAHCSFTFGDKADWRPYVGMGTSFGRPQSGLMTTADFRTADSLIFWAKGQGTGWQLRAHVYSGLVFVDDIRITVTAVPSTWTRYSINFSQDRTGGFPAGDFRNWDTVSAYATHVLFQAVAYDGASGGELWIDDVEVWFR